MANLETFNFEMFSRRGNNACRSAVKKAQDKIWGKKRISEEEIVEYCSELVKKIAEKHREVRDTEPSSHIANFVNKALENAGYNFEISRWDFILPKISKIN